MEKVFSFMPRGGVGEEGHAPADEHGNVGAQSGKLSHACEEQPAALDQGRVRERERRRTEDAVPQPVVCGTGALVHPARLHQGFQQPVDRRLRQAGLVDDLGDAERAPFLCQQAENMQRPSH